MGNNSLSVRFVILRPTIPTIQQNMIKQLSQSELELLNIEPPIQAPCMHNTGDPDPKWIEFSKKVVHCCATNHIHLKHWVESGNLNYQEYREWITNPEVIAWAKPRRSIWGLYIGDDFFDREWEYGDNLMADGTPFKRS